MGRFAAAIHGGAGASRRLDYAPQTQFMHHLMIIARDRLGDGDSALNVAQNLVEEMEQSGLFVAGKGASPNSAGEFELEACIMDGTSRRAGAVAGLRNFKSPIGIARRVMQATPHVLLIADGAEQFAGEEGFETVPDNSWFTRAGDGESNHPATFLPNGTVGAAVLDRMGALAAATSSSGLFGKLAGRVADSALPGSGTWADSSAAISCTGQGELFIQAAAASRVAFHVGKGESLETASRSVLMDVLGSGGEGGFVAVDRQGNIAAPFVAEGMKRACLTVDGSIGVAIFDECVEGMETEALRLCWGADSD